MDDSLRPVTVMQRKEWNKQAKRWSTCPLTSGKFHQFSSVSEEGGESEIVAIVELDDGTIITPTFELIRFDDRDV